MPRKKRRHFTPEQKVSILREHLLDHTPISEVCETHNLQPRLLMLIPTTTRFDQHQTSLGSTTQW